MSKLRSFRVTDDFLKKLSEIQNSNQDDLNIKQTQEEIFDEMMDLYYSIIFLRNNHVMLKLLDETVSATLEQFTILNSKFHNAILEELKKK